jgi:flagellin-like hook-associated protein FlgL
MEVFSLPFQFNPTSMTSQRVLAGTEPEAMNGLTQSLRGNPDRPSHLQELASSHKNTETISKTKRGLRLRIRQDHQSRFLENISLAQALLKDTYSALGQLSDFLLRIRRMTIQMTGKTSNHQISKGTAKKTEKLLGKILKAVDNQDGGDYPFSQHHMVTSFSRKAQRKSFSEGDGEDMELEIPPDLNSRFNLLDSGLLTKPLKTLGEDCDLNPGINSRSRLSDLNLGKGITLGSIRVSKARMSWDIDLGSAATVGEVIEAINSCGIAGLSADISASQTGFQLSPVRLSEGGSGQEWSISEANGSTAREMGILDNPYDGQNLKPILTERTAVSLLKGGKGMMLGTIKLTLGDTEAVVDLGSASTIGEVIEAINGSISGIVASVNNSKRGISVESKLAGKSLVISDGDGRKSAQALGISGSPDILGALSFLMQGLDKDDPTAISAGLETLDLGLEEISHHRAKTEAKLKRLESIETRLRGLEPDTLGLLSEIAGSDVSKAAADLADQQSLFQSALKRGTAMVQPGFLEFIR